MSAELSGVQDVQREVEEVTGEAVLLGGAEVGTCIATLEPTNQQTFLSYQHTLVWFDLQQTQLLGLFHKSQPYQYTFLKTNTKLITAKQ